MAEIPFTSRDELVNRLTLRRVVELFDDDGDGQILAGPAPATGDLAALTQAISQANDEVVSIIFRKGFSLEQIQALSSDASLRRYATDICAQAAGERRSEFINAEGRGIWHAIGERARASLKALSEGELRSRLEGESAGANPNVFARVGGVNASNIGGADDCGCANQWPRGGGGGF